MGNSWTRAWFAALASMVLAVVITMSREEWLLKVEKPVMDWLLDGTDTSIWDNAAVLSSWWLILPGTLLLVAISVRMQPRIAAAIVITTAFAYALTGLLGALVGRVGPAGDITGTFPSFEVVRVAVFVGLVVLTFWWVGAPKLLWNIVLEIAIVLTLVVAIRGIVEGEIWPSDAVGSAVVAALTLITAAIVFEANPVSLNLKRPDSVKEKLKFKKQAKEPANAA